MFNPGSLQQLEREMIPQRRSSASQAESAYLAEGYGDVFQHLGESIHIPGSGTWLLSRPVRNSKVRDLTSPYPMLAFSGWPAFYKGLLAQAEEGRWISLVAVIDPADVHLVAADLPGRAIIRAWKPCYRVKLDSPIEGQVRTGHLRKARRSLSRLRIETFSQRSTSLEIAWKNLHDALEARHRVGKHHKVSESSIAAALALPHVRCFLAIENDDVIAGQLWLRHRDTWVSHWVASTPRGYELEASFALHWVGLNELRGTASWAQLGGTPLSAETGGLERFKRGWAQGQSTYYIYAEPLDEVAYLRMGPLPTADDEWYPSYRRPRLG